jgi:hypothetical protein
MLVRHTHKHPTERLLVCTNGFTGMPPRRYQNNGDRFCPGPTSSCMVLGLGGYAELDSDWDFLIPVDGPADDAHGDIARRRLYETEWEKGEVLNAMLCSR